MTFSNRLLKITDEEEWLKVSMLQRISFQVQSTTNSLEAMHGHMNHKTPRGNQFFEGFDRICKSLDSKYSKVSGRIAHNFDYIKRKTKKKLNNISEILESSCSFYDADTNSCLFSDKQIGKR